ncbi:MAG: oligopeptide transporter, OPT family [Deltaproteobacteria bacterium]|nr:oligopeptide transporter, OPT family [Deltaproteobacteria bacterium]
MSEPGKEFKPYVPVETNMKELTFKAVFLGIIMAIVLGAANAYLGLKAGMTVAATFPAAVIAMAVLRAFKGTVLEENIARTTGAVGEALAAGAIFTIPAFIMSGVWDDFDYLTSTALLLVGGVLGVFFVILLRRTFMEDQSLPFPESQACTEIVKAGQRGSSGAGQVFVAMGIAAVIEFFKNANGIQIIKENVRGVFGVGNSAFPVVSPVSSPAFMGVGFIIGPRLSAITAAGGVFGWLFLMPLLVFIMALADSSFGDKLISLLASGNYAVLYDGDKALGFIGFKSLYSDNIKLVAIGAMIVGAFYTLFSMRNSLIAGISRSVKSIGGGGNADEKRTDKDINFKVVLIAIGVLLLAMLGLYYYLCQNLGISIITMVVMAIAGFLFAAVAGYLVSIIGSSSNPISGLTLSTLLLAAGLLVLLGMGGERGSEDWTAGVLAVLGVATIVCCVAGVAGDMIQDWKVGYNLGGTPWRMEVGGLIGVVAAALVLVLPIMLLHKFGGGIGSDALPAPQAGLMATMADGIISGEMAWELIIIGMFFALALILIKSPSPMLIAVGMYLPFQTVLAIFMGGLVKWVLDTVVKRRTGGDKKKAEAVENRGLLVASGLVAGEALIGIILAAVVALNVKFFCTEDYQGKVEQAALTVVQVEKVVGVEGTLEERAEKFASDPAKLAAVAVLRDLKGPELKDQVKGKMAVAETIGGTKCLGTTPGWFENYWLGFLVILGLGFYIVRTSLQALKEEDSGDDPDSPDTPDKQDKEDEAPASA